MLNRQMIALALATGVALTTTTASQVQAYNHGGGHATAAKTEAKNIVETAAAAGSFNTLLAAAKAAGLAETLSIGGPFTVFAPTDAAFAKLPEGTVEALLADPEKLKGILLYHVVNGTVTSDAVVKLDSAKTLQGQNVTVKVEDGKVRINNATVTAADVRASNGVIHVIDTVILPPAAPSKNIVEVAVGAGSFSILVDAVTAADLAATLSGEGPFTVFAPTDEAFAKLPPGTVQNLLKPENKEKLTSILLHHVVAGKVEAKDVVGLSEATLLSGKKLPIAVSEEGVRIGTAKVIATDVAASNGVIHVIDTVLIP